MKIWSAEEAQKATGGELIGITNWDAVSISIDSRTTRKGDLFIALRGTKTDGHDFIREAFLKGAAAVMVEQVPPNFPTTSASIIKVDDCIKALTKLAEYRRNESKAKIIAVTGSVGKTSTKEMLNVVFSSLGITHVSAGNNNNEIGVPLSLAKMPQDAEFGIFEIGMNHANEISPLSELVRPDIAIITTIAEVHIENFENLQGIADAKAEIFDGLKGSGIAILNKDNEFFDYLSKKAKDKSAKKIISFGEDFMSDIRLVEHSSASNGSVVHCKVGFEEFGYHVAARGKHMAHNSLAVLAAVQAVGAEVREAAEAFSSFSAQKGRGQILQIELGNNNARGKATIIDETYNASPISVRAALSNIGDIECTGRKIVVLGDMLELGESSRDLHEDLATDIIRNQIDLVYTVGEFSKSLFYKLPKEIQGFAFDEKQGLIGKLHNEIKPGDVVLIKASNGVGLSSIIEDLTMVAENAI